FVSGRTAVVRLSFTLSSQSSQSCAPSAKRGHILTTSTGTFHATISRHAVKLRSRPGARAAGCSHGARTGEAGVFGFTRVGPFSDTFGFTMWGPRSRRPSVKPVVRQRAKL